MARLGATFLLCLVVALASLQWLRGAHWMVFGALIIATSTIVVMTQGMTRRGSALTWSDQDIDWFARVDALRMAVLFVTVFPVVREIEASRSIGFHLLTALVCVGVSLLVYPRVLRPQFEALRTTARRISRAAFD